MPIDYRKYPPNWKTEIRPRILARAENKCECCKVLNYKYIFRGFLPCGKEVYQDSEGDIFDADNSERLYHDPYASIKPLSGEPNQKAIKVILTVAHLDHDEENWEVNDERLKAMCQRCHLRYDAEEKKRRKLIKNEQGKE